MKSKTLLLILILSISNTLFSQEKEKNKTGWELNSQRVKDSMIVKIDTTFFLLGTLNGVT